MRLELRSPIFYRKIYQNETNLQTNLPENEEILYCYELNPKQCQSIEPEMEHFLGSLVFAGQKKGGDEQADIVQPTVSLPQGLYLFVQERCDQTLNQEKWLDLAIEQQKDGLWERNKLGNLLYIRFLYEDEAVVTQIFRVCLP